MPAEIVVVSVDQHRAGDGIVRLVFHLSRSPNAKWKKAFDNASIIYPPAPGVAELMNIPLQMFRAEVYWTVPSDELASAEAVVRRRVDRANAQNY